MTTQQQEETDSQFDMQIKAEHAKSTERILWLDLSRLLVLLVMLLLGAAIALVLKIIHGLPSITGWILEKIEGIQKIVTGVSKSATVPVVRPAALMAGIRRIFSKGKSRVQID